MKKRPSSGIPTTRQAISTPSNLSRHQTEFGRRHYEVEIDKDVLFALRERARRTGIPVGRLASDMLRRISDRCITPHSGEVQFANDKRILPTCRRCIAEIPAEPVERIVGILKDAQANRRRILCSPTAAVPPTLPTWSTTSSRACACPVDRACGSSVSATTPRC